MAVCANAARTNVNGGLIEGSVTANESSKINIAGGDFPNVFSGGGGIVAAGPGAMVVITGGNFGTAGENDGGAILASQGAMVSYSSGNVVGLASGTAPAASFSAVLNGVVNLSDSVFGDLVLEAGNNGTLNVENVVADNISLHTIAGGTVNFEGGLADSLEVFAELGSFVNIAGGNFDEIDIRLETSSVLKIFGSSFRFLGTPVELLPDPNAYIEETGELRTIGGVLAGSLADGTPFSLTFSRQFFPPPGARVFLVNVPEPATLLLILAAGAGVVFHTRRGRRQS